MGGGASRGVRPERSGGRPWRGSVVPVGTVPKEALHAPARTVPGNPLESICCVENKHSIVPVSGPWNTCSNHGDRRRRARPGRPRKTRRPRTTKRTEPIDLQGINPLPRSERKDGPAALLPVRPLGGETSRNKSDAAPGRRRSRPRTGTTPKRRSEGAKKAQKKAPSTAPCGKSIASPDTRSAGLREKGKRKGSRHTTSNVHRPPFQGPPGGFLTGAPVTILPNIQLMLLVSANSPGSGCSLDVRIPLVRPRNRIASRM